MNFVCYFKAESLIFGTLQIIFNDILNFKYNLFHQSLNDTLFRQT
jgi:hypothetical protein